MTTATRAAPDAIIAAAIDVARAAAVEAAGEAAVGEHAGVEADDERVATHLFECREPAYRGWRWGVQLVRASRAKDVTVNGVYRLPGPDSLLAPPWVPWADRLRPGDLGVGDLLPAPVDDDRLVLAIEDVESGIPLMEWGLGRARVLSYIGRVEAAERWYEGDAGPDTPHARHAPAPCLTCGFFVSLAGPLGQGFGVCANEFAPDDGRVVSVDHGCGAHSEGSLDVASMGPSPALVDEYTFELVPEPRAEEPAVVPDDAGPVPDAEPAAAYDLADGAAPDDLEIEIVDVEPDAGPDVDPDAAADGDSG